MIILGIETSCDETAAAVLEIKQGKFKVLSNIVSSQINLHKKYGGVVPELAARMHTENIIEVVNQALSQAKITPKNLNKIAVTAGPGLITALLVGVQTAKTLAYAWNKPLVPINHMKAHLYASWLENKKITFPAVALLVSGGHTEIIYLKSNTTMKKIGQTVDDAAGEAFDKVAALLKLGYPGGPKISLLAQKGNNKAFKFPRPMINENNFNFSFAGLKTAVLYTVQKIKNLNMQTKADLAASFQQASIDVLVSKTIKAAKQHQVKTIILSGGVAANKLLRQTLETQAKQNGFNFFKPPHDLCTDNAAMIAAAAYFEKDKNQKVTANPNISI